jgi:hypothetical protein
MFADVTANITMAERGGMTVSPVVERPEIDVNSG